MAQSSTQLDSSTLPSFTKEGMRLPIKLKGIGLQSLFGHQLAKFIGGIIQGIPTLIDQMSPSNATLKRKGKCHTGGSLARQTLL